MRILYLSGGHGAEYMCDSLFHGLRTLLGPDLVDANQIEYMYKGRDLTQLYGKGFSLYGLLDDIEIDRTDIEHKVKSHYFDYVIYGSIQRTSFLFGDVRNAYKPSEILLIDGEDNPLLFRDLMSAGIYLKRELHSPQPRALPIQFAIPAEKLSSPQQRKDLLMAPLDPWDPRTYIYDDEESYYQDYRRSMFAKTSKKAGWDCMRHYEIMACYCLPYFENLEQCPQTIMTRLPKAELLLAKNLLEYQEGRIFHTSAGRDLWQDLMSRVFHQLKTHLVTTAVATYVLDIAREASGKTVEMETVHV